MSSKLIDIVLIRRASFTGDCHRVCGIGGDGLSFSSGTTGDDEVKIVISVVTLQAGGH